VDLRTDVIEEEEEEEEEFPYLSGILSRLSSP
jgi:hypothetical protein